MTTPATAINPSVQAICFFDINCFINGNFLALTLALLRVSVVECAAQGPCELHRIVVRPEVHVEEARHVIQCMAMQSYCLNAVVLQNLHHGSNLFPRQREVPSNGGFPIAGWLEVDRDAHPHRWRRIHPLFRELLCARHVDMQHSTTHVAGGAKDLLHGGHITSDIFALLRSAALWSRWLCDRNRLRDRPRHLHRVAVSTQVDVEDSWCLPDQMVVDSRGLPS